MNLELDALLAPVSDASPAGPDLSYDPEFLELEHAARGKPEQQFGDTTTPAQEPDWQDVRRRSEALLARSKDLRVAVLLTRALVRLDNAEGLAAGLSLVREMLSRYWDTLHPELDRDDNDDPTMRLNALAPLADNATLLRDIRNAPLVASAHARIAFRDVLVAAGKLPPSDGATPSQSEIEGAIRESAAHNGASLQAALDAAELVQGLEALLGEKGVSTQAPDLRPLRDMLSAVAPLCKAALASDAAPEEVTQSAAHDTRAQLAGPVTSRDDAIRALENVCRYIEQAEPSNPAPLLIRRAQKLIGRKFVEIIEELAPESLGQIQKLAGLEK